MRLDILLQFTLLVLLPMYGLLYSESMDSTTPAKKRSGSLVKEDLANYPEFVAELYQQYFGRTPEEKELNVWVGILEFGSMSEMDVEAQIAKQSREEAGGNGKVGPSKKHKNPLKQLP